MRILILAPILAVASACVSPSTSPKDSGAETVWEICHTQSDFGTAYSDDAVCCPEPDLGELLSYSTDFWGTASKAACLEATTAGYSAGWEAGEACTPGPAPDVSGEAESTCAASTCTLASAEDLCLQTCQATFISCHDAGWTTAYAQAATQAGCSR